MRLYLETLDSTLLQELERWGSFAGVSVTGTLLDERGQSVSATALHLATTTAGDLLVPIEGSTADQLEEVARAVNGAEPSRVMVKLRVNPKGLEVMNRLRDERIWTVAAPIAGLGQALLAASSGADLLMPDSQAIRGCGQLPAQVIREIGELCRSRGGRPKVVVSGLLDVEDVLAVARLGVWGAVITPATARELLGEALDGDPHRPRDPRSR
jgi:hypothetical protein